MVIQGGWAYLGSQFEIHSLWGGEGMAEEHQTLGGTVSTARKQRGMLVLSSLVFSPFYLGQILSPWDNVTHI